MPLSGADRAKRFIEKLKKRGKIGRIQKKSECNGSKLSKKIKRWDEKLSRKKQQQKIEEERQKIRDRVRKHRQNKKGNRVVKTKPAKKIIDTRNNSVNRDDSRNTSAQGVGISDPQVSLVEVPYKTAVSLRKAISRMNAGLPKSIEKHKCVVTNVYEKLVGIPKPVVTRSSGKNHQTFEKRIEQPYCLIIKWLLFFY